MATITACEAGSDRFRARFLEREPHGGTLDQLFTGPEPSLLCVREDFIQPILTEAIHGTADTVDAAKVNTDTDDHRPSPERTKCDSERRENDCPSDDNSARTFGSKPQKVDLRAGLKCASATNDGNDR